MKTNRESLNSAIFQTGKRSILLILAGIVIFVISCSKSSSSDVTFKATINGPSETPANSSTASGTATLTYNMDTKIFSIVVQYTGLTPIAGHIHKGAVGVPGNVIFPFSNPLTSPINYTSPALDSTQEADLMSNQYYVNLHTTAFPTGEIRGQLLKQ